MYMYYIYVYLCIYMYVCMYAYAIRSAINVTINIITNTWDELSECEYLRNKCKNPEYDLSLFIPFTKSIFT